MNNKEKIESIRKIDNLIDNINELIMIQKKRKLTDLEKRKLRGYSTKHSMWIHGIVNLDGLSTQEYVDNYHLFEKQMSVFEYNRTKKAGEKDD